MLEKIICPIIEDGSTARLCLRRSPSKQAAFRGLGRLGRKISVPKEQGNGQSSEHPLTLRETVSVNLSTLSELLCFGGGILSSRTHGAGKISAKLYSR
jgi:hypothetical protein